MRPAVRRALRSACALALVGGAIVACKGSQANDAPWTLVWSDEFDETALDSTKWKVDTGNSFGTGQQDFDTAQNLSVSGGYLTITAKEESYMGSSYTSGRIETSGLFSQTYGRFEARIKIPQGQGMWPAFWMLGSNYSTQGWPQCGEIDIMENAGADPTTVFGSMHGPGGDNKTQGYQLPGTASFADDFHIFAVEWEPGEIRWYVDSTQYETQDADLLPNSQQWVFDDPFFVILNLAVGGTYAGPTNSSVPFPQTMVVDYVHVYSRPEPS
jgi:beta-glucanase (GH16 family)